MRNTLKEFFNRNELKQAKSIADSLNLKFSFYNLKKLKNESGNAYEISNNLVYLYPLKTFLMPGRR